MKLEDDKPITIRKKTELCDYCAYLECSDDCNCPDCSPLQEPREKKTIPLEWCYVHKKKNCIQPLPPQPEKTDYQKRIEEILNDNTFFSEKTDCLCLNKKVIKELLSLLQEVRSEERTKIKRRVGFLRQWLNEDRITRIDKMVDTGDLDDWLFTDKL
jgi:hypothetical protein